MILLKIAWRNIWRNRLRSAVVILAIVIGIFAGVFTISFSFGLNNQRTEAMLNSMISHIQIHDSVYLEEVTTSAVIQEQNLFSILDQDERIKAYSPRLSVMGMAQSAATSGGVMIQAIDKNKEEQVTDIHTKLIEGDYLTTGRNPIVIGQKLSEKLKIGLKKYLVLTFQDKEGEVVSSRFKVVGIFKSISGKLDESLVFINLSDASRLMGIQNQYHEVALVLNNVKESKLVAMDLQSKMPRVKVEPWQTVSPELGYADSTMELQLYIIMGIILLALIGGIINTMLMVVLERTRELGMILSIGMNKLRVFYMILIETFILALIGGPLGLAVGYFVTNYYANVGIELTGMDEGLQQFGMANVVYPAIEWSQIFSIVIMVLIMAFLSAILPGLRAIKLKPAEAVRAI